MKGGKALDQRLVDLEGSAGVKFIHKSRDVRMGGLRGGVAIAFNAATCNFKKRNIKHAKKHQEILCCVGKVAKIKRSVVAFIIYVSPGMKNHEFEELKEVLAREITAAKVSYGNPISVVGGDFNHWDI